MAQGFRRLYGSFHPDSYSLDLALDPDSMSFKGKVVIDGNKVGRPSKRLTFHQKNLKFSSIKIVSQGPKTSQEFVPSRINLQKSFDEVRIHFDRALYSGRYRITISYEGKINPQLHGIYASSFKDRGKDKTIICTQFEPHHAREALPCIDEPEAKAVFNLTLKVPAGLTTVISNGEALSEISEKGHKSVNFAPTPKMSSYLLAFIVGDLKYLESRTKSNVRVRTYTTPKMVEYSRFALDAAVRTLDFYDEYFALPYPLTKCDLVALPDFSAGAMENWGCITFREQALIVDPKTTSLDLKQYVANVVAHELTHQWFGNLVTMRWWNDLWLNESFASWMSYLAVDHIFPEWKVWTQFIVDEQAVGLRLDSLEYTHPVEVKINNPDEINVVFDAISYEKGASLITMLQDYLGAEAFRDGIRLYLAEHTYGNTDTIDLWQALETVSSKEVGKFMSHWTKKSGYPMLKAVYQNQNLRLEQHRFYLNPLAEKEPTLWPIPLFADLNLGKNDPFFHRALNMTLPTLPGSLLINKGRKGFYRVIYDDLTVDSLLADGFLERVSDVDRLGLIADAFESAKAGYLPTLSVLKILEKYLDETSLVVWEAIAGGLGSIRSAMDDEELREQIKPFIRKLVKKELDRLGLSARDDDSHFDRLLRPIILGMAAIADEPSVITEVNRLFYKEDIDKLDPDIRGVVYSAIARRGAKYEFDTLLKMHNDSDSPEERLKLAAALTNFHQPQLIKESLKLIRSKSVRLQDATYWISYSFSNHDAKEATWQWLKDSWDWLEENMNEDLSFYRLPQYAARNFSSFNFLKEFKEFFETHMSPVLDRPIKQAVETIEWQAEWKKRDLDNIKLFFTQRTKT